MKKLYRLQVLQQLVVGMPCITFKVDTFTTRDGASAIEWMILKGEEYLKSGTVTEDCEEFRANEMITELHDYIGSRGWI